MRISDWSLVVCSSDLFFYYNSALRVIKELAIEPDEALRVTTRTTFIKRIDTSSYLFDEWFVAKLGTAKYYRALRNEFFAAGVNISPADRLFIIHPAGDTYSRNRSEEPRVGKEGVSTCRSRWSQSH